MKPHEDKDIPFDPVLTISEVKGDMELVFSALLYLEGLGADFRSEKHADAICALQNSLSRWIDQLDKTVMVVMDK